MKVSIPNGASVEEIAKACGVRQDDRRGKMVDVLIVFSTPLGEYNEEELQENLQELGSCTIVRVSTRKRLNHE